MAVLNKIKASTLAESIIAMTLSLFLFGFIAWFFVAIDQNRHKQKYKTIYLILLQDQNHQKEEMEMSLMDFDIISSNSVYNGDERLVIKEIEITDKAGQTIYQHQTWEVDQFQTIDGHQ